jgi:hypothetical protein
MKLVQRCGYGGSFNDIFIDGDKIIKKCKHSGGVKKIENEITFYNFIKCSCVDFPVVNVVGYIDNGYIMEYLKDYEPLYKSKNIDFDLVYNKLNILHSSYELKVSKEYFMSQLYNEIDKKIIERYKIIEHVVSEYNFIKRVNGLDIMKFEELHKKINNEIHKEIDSLECYKFVPIHGDCQFNNILVKDGNIVFIDPRGHFGESSIFGMKEYDMAKVLFAISGYDEFDSRSIDNIDICDDELLIELKSLRTDIFNRPKLEVLLMLNIWMGNAHSFVNNKYKMIYSYFISLYLGSLYFSTTQTQDH